MPRRTVMLAGYLLGRFRDPPGATTADPARAAASIALFSDLSYAKVVFGHGRAVLENDRLSRFRDFVASRRID